jgi:hypothetical protein
MVQALRRSSFRPREPPSSLLTKWMTMPGTTPRPRSLIEAQWPAGCSERPFSKAAASEEAESYSVPYVEPLSDARTMRADFVNSLLVSLSESLPYACRLTIR